MQLDLSRTLIHLTAPIAFVLAGVLLLTPVVQAESGTPAASPIASPAAGPFPEGLLGDQAAWTWETLNSNTPIPESELEQHLAPEVLAQAPAAQISVGLVQLQQVYGPFTFETGSVETFGEPPTRLTYIVAGKDGTRFMVGVSLDPASGLLDGYLISPAPTPAPAATPLPVGITDTDISFTSGGDMIYGSLMAPADLSGSDQRPAALIISGSGPTDRNGDSPGYSGLGTNRNLALTLAATGIPSLRYDKLGSGQTGLGSHGDGSGIGYDLFRQEAADAAIFLASQPGVDPNRLIIIGHSEGALFALTLAQEMTAVGAPPAGVILVAPLAIRYLDIVQRQVSAQTAAAVASGQMTQEAGDKIETDLATVIESIRATGELPDITLGPELAPLFTPMTIEFLAQIDKIDPAEIAASLPSDLPVLVLLGEKDSQVTPDEVDHLMAGFTSAGNTNATMVMLPNANHALRIVEGTANPSVDYRNPDLPFSPDAVTAIDDFLAKYGLTS